MGEAGHEMGEARYCGLAPPPAVMCSCVRVRASHRFVFV